MFTVTFVHTVHVKRMQQFVKICVPLFDKKLRLTFMLCLWICARSAGTWIAAIFAKCATFSRQKAPCTILELWCFTRRCTAARPSKCGVFGGRKWHTCHHVFKCHCGTFVAFLLTCTICMQYMCMNTFLHITITWRY